MHAIRVRIVDSSYVFSSEVIIIMEQPKILGVNIIACAANKDAVFASIAAVGKTAGMIAVAGICSAPAVGAMMAGGFAA